MVPALRHEHAAGPETWESFQAYYDHMCREVLEDNKATRDVLEIGAIPKPPLAGWLPDLLWRPIRSMIAPGFVWLTVGMYHPAVRERLGCRWSAWDARLHRLVGCVINLIFTVVPFERRYHPRARVGWQRVRGTIPADAGLVETPARNPPPLAERGNPKHYAPKV